MHLPARLSGRGFRVALRASLLLAAACVPAAASAETLADAVALAYQTNPAIQASRAQLRALNESYVQARAGLGPRVSAEVDLNYEEVRNDHERHVEGRSSTEQVSLSQPVFAGGRVATAIQAAEVRQMLAAKAERQKVRGEPVLDVEAESERLLAEADKGTPTPHEEELRAEVRQLVVARNERRRRQGLGPLDVAAETERQLADLSG